MFDLSPSKLLVLAIVGLIVLGPDRLPGLAKDAARMIRTLRELATGARTQLRDELGPEFADVDLRNLNPRVALSRAILGDDADKLQTFNPRNAIQRGIFGGDQEVEPESAPTEPATVSLQKPTARRLVRGERASHDSDAT